VCDQVKLLASAGVQLEAASKAMLDAWLRCPSKTRPVVASMASMTKSELSFFTCASGIRIAMIPVSQTAGAAVC
jgi:hypothetical protein